MQCFTILIVEDEPDLRELLVDVLSDYGHSCMEAKDGQEGLEAVKAGKIDFVITDIKMPVMDGLTMLRCLNELEQATPPVLIVSGFSDISNDDQAQKLGAVGFRKKPYNIDELNQLIDTYLMAGSGGE